MSQDPFLEAQADILALLQQSRPLLSSYLRIRSSASSANSPELVEARQELENTLTDLTADLQDLVESVRAVEGDPARYGLTVQEVGRRRKLVDDAAREVEDMHRQLNDTVQSANAQRRASLAHPDSFHHLDQDEDPLTGHGENDGDEYGAWEEQRQMEIMHEQDEALEGVFQTVGNIRLQADTMGRELEEQAELLDEVDTVTERVGGKLGVGMKKIRHVLEKGEDRYSGCCIGLLIVVLIILLILVLVLTSIDLTSRGISLESVRDDTTILARMHDERSHPLLQQTPLSVNPYIDLPKPPTLPHNYASIPTTLPPSALNAPPAPSNPDLPAYVTSSSGFAAHPNIIIAQNKALLEQLDKQKKDAEKKVQEWERSIQERELAEKRRKAPGWLDSEQHLLQPEKKVEQVNLMDEPGPVVEEESKREKKADELGDAMDRAFGRSEMG